jgi:hypothetical protein
MKKSNRREPALAKAGAASQAANLFRHREYGGGWKTGKPMEEKARR